MFPWTIAIGIATNDVVSHAAREGAILVGGEHWNCSKEPGREFIMNDTRPMTFTRGIESARM